MQLQNNRHTSGEDVVAYLWRSKMLADELAAAGASIPSRVFNAMIYNNLGAEYGEIVIDCLGRPASIGWVRQTTRDDGVPSNPSENEAAGRRDGESDFGWKSGSF